MNKYIPIYVIILSVFIGIISFGLFSDGMFFDGVFYANFSKVMGLNYTGFWNLKDCITCENLYGHPPLAIFLQSLLFRIFGDSIYVERFYSLFSFLITGGIIHLIYKEINPIHKELSWSALLLWISIPLVTWSAANNMLENTMQIFVLCSVLFSIKSLHKHRCLNIFISAFFIFLGFLSKGLFALFPLSFFLWIYIFIEKKQLKRHLLNNTLLVLATMLFFLIIYIFSEDGTNYIIRYFKDQLLFSLENEHNVNTRFYIVIRMINEILPPLIISMIVLFFTRKFVVFSKKSNNFKWSLMLFCLALSGVIPIMLSLKQSGFYILATFPIFSLSFAFLIKDNVVFLMDKFYSINILKNLKIISILLFIISIGIAFSQRNKISRDVNKIKDVYTISKYVKSETTLTIPHELYWDWALKSYFFRYGSISLDSNHDNLNTFFIIEKNKDDKLLEKYQQVDIDLNNYNLFKITHETKNKVQ